MAKTKSATKIVPLGDRVLIQRVAAEESTKGGIILPDSAKEKPREGVVLAEGIEALFRNVPPSLVLALAMTEKEEKAERFQIMSENGCSELDAAVEVGRRIDSMRGIDVTRDKYSTQEMVQ